MKRTCHKCKTEKPLEDFHKDVRRGDGHTYKCKECARNNAYEHKMGKPRVLVNKLTIENRKVDDCGCSKKNYKERRENPCTH